VTIDSLRCRSTAPGRLHNLYQKPLALLSYTMPRVLGGSVKLHYEICLVILGNAIRLNI
jgi:hypothetical protein